jgi:hypothetical protein
MLYMKTRVTFRVAEDLAEALRELPNQTLFVERALRAALGRTCPTCDGSGRIDACDVRVSNFRQAALPALNRDSALQLKKLVHLSRRIAATRIRLNRKSGEQALSFAIERGRTLLLSGSIRGAVTSLEAGAPWPT